LYRDSLEGYRRALGESHPRFIGTLIGLGTLLVDRNDAPDAEPLLREAVAIAQKAFRPEHWRVAEAEAALGSAVSALGDETDGERLLVRGYLGLEKTRGENDPRTRSALRWLIGHHERWGHTAAASRLRGSLRNAGASFDHR